MIEGTAGIMVGISQAFTILPFDALRTKAQTNLELVQGKSISQLFQTEGFKLYNGAINVAMRNSISSFVLFSVPSIVFQYGYGLTGNQKPNFTQRLSAYTVSAITASIITNPFDVIKTRVQAKQDAKTSAIFIKTIREEGLQAFRKGLVPKLSTAVPKLAFTFTVTPYVAEGFTIVENNMNRFFFHTAKNRLNNFKKASPALHYPQQLAVNFGQRVKSRLTISFIHQLVSCLRLTPNILLVSWKENIPTFASCRSYVINSDHRLCCFRLRIERCFGYWKNVCSTRGNHEVSLPVV